VIDHHPAMASEDAFFEQVSNAHSPSKLGEKSNAKPNSGHEFCIRVEPPRLDVTAHFGGAMRIVDATSGIKASSKKFDRISISRRYTNSNGYL
jgi:hypothetical protein